MFARIVRGLSALPRRRIFIGATSVAILGVAVAVYLSLGNTVSRPLYSSFLVLDGKRIWLPFDMGRSVGEIEALQEIERLGLQNALLELDRDPHSDPTAAELETLWALYRDSFESAERNGWFDYRNAIRDGFYEDGTDPSHYPHETYLTDGRNLDPGRPEFLMYHPHPKNEYEKFLVGFMYQQSAFDAHGEQVGGSVARWHKHVYGAPVCFEHNLTPHGAHGQQECEGTVSSESPEMLHVWLVDHPISQFASEMSLGFEVTERPRMMSKDAFLEKHRRLPERGQE